MKGDSGANLAASSFMLIKCQNVRSQAGINVFRHAAAEDLENGEKGMNIRLSVDWAVSCSVRREHGKECYNAVRGFKSYCICPNKSEPVNVKINTTS